MSRRTTWILLVSLAGIALLFALFPRFDVSGQTWKFSLSRQQAEAAAAATAGRYGVDIRGWPTVVAYDENRTQQEAKRIAPNDPVLADFPGLSIRVLATSPGAREDVIVTLAPNGSPLSFERRIPQRAYARREPEGEALARHELAHFAGQAAASYKITAAGVRTQIGSRWIWERVSEQTEGVLARFEAVIRDERVLRVSLSCQVSGQLLSSQRERPEAGMLFWLGVMLPIGIAAVLAAGWTVFVRLTRGKDHLLFGLRVAFLLAVLLSPALLTGNLRNDLTQTSGGRGADQNWWIAGLIALLMVLALTVMLTSAGYALLGPRERARWAGLKLVAEGKILSCAVGRDVFLGLIAGAGLAALPYLLDLAPGWFPATIRWSGPRVFGEPSPAAYAIYRLLPWETLGLFAFILPLMHKLIRQPRLSWAASAAVGGLWMAAMQSPFEGALWADLACGALIWGGFALIYEGAGLLAVWMAPMGMGGAVACATLLNSPGSGLVHEGWRMAGIWLAALAVCVAIWLWGKAGAEEAAVISMGLGEQEASFSERDRLGAELDVARRVQQEMLRGELPAIPGFSLSAACEPARQVGGDLYDFLEFPDSRWGLCVADVSGKGLAAALYMTLTKGMLASARLHSSDLEEIVTRLNHHLGLAGRRKTFVTMSLASLDAGTRKLKHVRAGHNPPLYWRASEGQAELLSPKGIGLGLTGRNKFLENLESQQIQLEDGDVVVFYSDGLVECMDESREQFGEPRMEEVLRSHAHMRAQEICGAVLEAARRFRGKAEPHDDLTILVLKAESQGVEAAA